MENQPPPAIRLAAACAVVYGAISLVKLVASPFLGGFVFELGVVGIPIGRGLLAGQRSAQRWGITLSALGLVMYAIVAFKIPSSEYFQTTTRSQLWLDGIHFFPHFLADATVLIGLCSPSGRSWFRGDFPDRADGRGWMVPLVFIGALLGTSLVVQEYDYKKGFADLFVIHTRFEFLTTNRSPLSSVGYSWDGMNLPREKGDLRRPRVWASLSVSTKPFDVTLVGLAGRPVKVTFTSDGFQPANYTLRADSPREVVLVFRAVP